MNDFKAINLDKISNDELNAIIAKIEGRATTRKISAEAIRKILENAARPVPTKKALEGTKVRWTGGRKFPSAYKYTPDSTHFLAEFKRGHWWVVDVYRDSCPNRQDSCDIYFSDTAKEAIIEKLSAMSLDRAL